MALGRVNIRLGSWVRPLAPGYSWCRRCKTPWLFVEPHVTDYTRFRGLFALCERCWAELTPEHRVPFYRELVTDWHATPGKEPSFDEEWALVQTAVLNGG